MPCHRQETSHPLQHGGSLSARRLELLQRAHVRHSGSQSSSQTTLRDLSRARASRGRTSGRRSPHPGTLRPPKRCPVAARLQRLAPTGCPNCLRRVSKALLRSNRRSLLCEAKLQPFSERSGSCRADQVCESLPRRPTPAPATCSGWTQLPALGSWRSGTPQGSAATCSTAAMAAKALIAAGKMRMLRPSKRRASAAYTHPSQRRGPKLSAAKPANARSAAGYPAPHDLPCRWKSCCYNLSDLSSCCWSAASFAQQLLKKESDSTWAIAPPF
mmetsp:Transcript_73706/g.240068  ORF Transcript_73706/g.240068 Transcript_73706/m.240068 type:complete len:272 (+) Transcript_73706:1111-1926(+)